MLQVEAAASVRRREQREHRSLSSCGSEQSRALRELLTSIAARQTLVVYIDDLHWADADSAVLLEELLRPPQAPPILTIACLRTEEMASKPFLQTLLERTGSKAGIALPLEPMTDDEAQALLASAIDVNAPVSAEGFCRSPARRVAIRSCSDSSAASRSGPARGNASDVCARCWTSAFVRCLGKAQRFLETLVICGRPMAPALICDACGIAGERQSLVAMLRASHFIRSSGSSERVETYHDRIREVLAAQMAPDAVRRIHGLMVQALVEQAKRRLRGAVRTLSGRRRSRKRLRFRPALPPRKRAPRSPSTGRRSSTGRLSHWPGIGPAAAAWKEGLAKALAQRRPAGGRAADAYLRAAAEADHRGESSSSGRRPSNS